MGSLVLTIRKEKPDAGKLGIGSTEGKNLMMGAWYWQYLQFGKKKLYAEKHGIGSSKEKIRCWEAWYQHIRKEKHDAGKICIGSS
jgi:hypothetical protein